MHNSLKIMWLGLLLLGAAACDDDKKTTGEYPYACDEPRCRPEAGAGQPTRAVDVVFVIENSLPTIDIQYGLWPAIPHFVRALEAAPGGLPDLHLGVITPDLGSAPYNIPGCEREGGDGGRFLKGEVNVCVNPVGQNYVVDVAPRGCTVTRGTDGACTAHDCAAANCAAAAFAGPDGVPTEPDGLLLATDEQGCPRCRNYSDQPLEEVLQCLASVGMSGCGMEQPLEALFQALVVVPEENERFLRPAAGLGVMTLMTEDDCSVADPELFNPEGDVNSYLGKLSNFRCTEFGIVCHQPWERPMNAGQTAYWDCRPRESGDPDNLLHPIDRYTEALRGLKPSGLLAVASLGADTSGVLVTASDLNQNPSLLPGCGAYSEHGEPTLRLSAFVRALTDREEDLSWALFSICDSYYPPPFQAMGDRLAAFTTARCVGLPLAGCPDPAAAFGRPPLTALPERYAAVCAPTCAVFEAVDGGDPVAVPPCPAGHAGGHPAEVDPVLPVPACFHVVYVPGCAVPCALDDPAPCDPVDNPWWGPSRGAAIVISRRATPAVTPAITFSCEGLPLFETGCTDGLDEDLDGLVDAADPDCR